MVEEIENESGRKKGRLWLRRGVVLMVGVLLLVMVGFGGLYLEARERDEARAYLKERGYVLKTDGFGGGWYQSMAMKFGLPKFERVVGVYSEPKNANQLRPLRGRIVGITMFQRVKFEAGDWEADWAAMLKLPDLEELLLYRSGMTDAQLARVGQWPRLTYFSLHGWKALDGERHRVVDSGPWLSLEQLPVGDEVQPGVLQVRPRERAALRPDQVAPKRWEGVTDEGLLHLSSLTKLQWLELSNLKITGAGFKHLVGLEALEQLKLTECGLTGEGFEHLARLKRLVSFDCRYNELEDENMRLLEGSSFEKMDLQYNPLGDGALESFAKMYRLESLELSHTQATVEKAKEVLAGIPRLKVEGRYVIFGKIH